MKNLIILTLHDGHIHVVRGRTKLFKLLVGEDIDSNKMDFGVTVLASLRSEILMKRETLDVDISTTLQGRPLIMTNPPLRMEEHYILESSNHKTPAGGRC